MMRLLYTLSLNLIIVVLSQAQVIFNEDFEIGSLPVEWTQETNATDGGWKIGSAASLSSQYWPITDNGSTGIAATNDDACNCNKSRDRLITPPFDFTGLNGVVLNVDVFFGKGTYEGYTEQAAIEVSLDGTTWTLLENLHGHGGWDTHSINLSSFAGEDSVYVSFNYNDGGGYLFGLAIDNVTIAIPSTLDAELAELNSRAYGETNTNIAISGTVYNRGLTPITSLDIQYSINDGPSVSALLEGLNIQPFDFFEVIHPTAWIPSIAGSYEIKVDIITINGLVDENANNNSLSFQTEIYPLIIPPNKIDKFLNVEPVFTTIATAADELNKPTDLDFFPILGKNELWIVNEKTESVGGSTLTIYDAGTPDQSFVSRADGNAWHFMSLPTGIAFSENFNFATSPGVKDANHGGGTFTGPTLWTSDPEIYAQPSGGNGSHLDMLHGSPYSMGIASESDNVFWVFDGWNETIVRYDFQDDHGPGNDDHADGLVRRYTEIKVKRDVNVPSHLVIDKPSGWLYAVDNGNNRVIRLDIHSGNVLNAMPLINEPLEEHSQMGNVTWEVIIDSLDRPCGIEIIGNRLLVGEYTKGEIIIYDIENNFTEIGRIATGEQGLTGIKVGPDGNIWYTNRLENTLTRVEPGEITNTKEEGLLTKVQIWPNPAADVLVVKLPDMYNDYLSTIKITDLSGRQLLNLTDVSGTQQINVGHLPNGIYWLIVSYDKFRTATQVVLNNHSN